MAAKPTSDPTRPGLSSLCVERAPYPMAQVEGAMHVVRYTNPAFCRLIAKTRDALAGKPFRKILPEEDECLTQLDRVYRTGNSESYTEQEHASRRPVFWSYTMWPVMDDQRIVGVMLQVIETGPFHEKTLAMNEALLLGSLRQHELTAAADASNVELRTEVGERKQRERDAQMLTNEVSHRVKNSLQLVVGLIGNEITQTTGPRDRSFEAMQTRIQAIAELYDVISQTSRGRALPVDAFLQKIAKAMSAALLEGSSGITIEVKAEALEIDDHRALPFGLLVNELVTNAVKHAFSHRTGRVMVNAERIGDQIELTVADNGVGMKVGGAGTIAKKHGADYVAIFARQLGGTIVVSGSDGTGTIIRVRLPLVVASSRSPSAEPGSALAG